jgi:hypothetical protein
LVKSPIRGLGPPAATVPAGTPRQSLGLLLSRLARLGFGHIYVSRPLPYGHRSPAEQQGRHADENGCSKKIKPAHVMRPSERPKQIRGRQWALSMFLTISINLQTWHAVCGEFLPPSLDNGPLVLRIRPDQGCLHSAQIDLLRPPISCRDLPKRCRSSFNCAGKLRAAQPLE